MVTGMFYDPGHDERYAHVPKSRRRLYPDRVEVNHRMFERIKTFDEMTDEDWDRYGPTMIRFACKDISIPEAQKM